MIAQDSEGDVTRKSYAAARWRLIMSGLADGPSNMAVDEAITEAVAAGENPPSLRFYGWQPACLSLGYRQPWTVVDTERCVAAGWDVVRRPTGGRAILHVDELTYSVIAPAGDPRVKGGILESYRRLSEALADGLIMLGLASAEAPPDPGTTLPAGLVCFDGPSNYEISHKGRKLVGSAQVRKKNVVLQHGTLPLIGDVGRVERCNRPVRVCGHVPVQQVLDGTGELAGVGPLGVAAVLGVSHGQSYPSALLCQTPDRQAPRP